MVLAAFLVLWAGQIGTGIGLIRELLAARTAAQGGLGWVPVALVGAARGDALRGSGSWQVNRTKAAGTHGTLALLSS